MDGDARLATRVPGDACRTESSLLLCGSRHRRHGRSHWTGSEAGFCALFADFGEPVPSILSGLENFDSIHFSPIEEVVLDSSICGRVVLLGDAAHATSPNMAEGASMALEDALVLAQMLAMHASPEEALSAFTKRRRTRIRWVQQRTHRRDRIRALPSSLRNLALRLAGTAIYQRDYRMLFEKP